MRHKSLKILIIVLLLVFVGFTLFVAKKNSYWDGRSRYRLVLGSSKGNAELLLFDPRKNKISTYRLDNSTELEAAYGLGSWKIESLWKLGEQEKKGGGVMLSKSLVRGLSIPVEGYLNYSGKPSSFGLTKSMLLSPSASLSLGDRLSLSWFVLRHNISEEGALKTNSIKLMGEELPQLSDGIVTLTLPPDFSESKLKALSELISNLGGKVLDVTVQKPENPSCKVMGKNTFSKKLAHILDCKFEEAKEEGINIVLGDDFAKTF